MNVFLGMDTLNQSSANAAAASSLVREKDTSTLAESHGIQQQNQRFWEYAYKKEVNRLTTERDQLQNENLVLGFQCIQLTEAMEKQDGVIAELEKTNQIQLETINDSQKQQEANDHVRDGENKALKDENARLTQRIAEFERKNRKDNLVQRDTVTLAAGKKEDDRETSIKDLVSNAPIADSIGSSTPIPSIRNRKTNSPAIWDCISFVPPAKIDFDPWDVPEHEFDGSVGTYSSLSNPLIVEKRAKLIFPDDDPIPDVGHAKVSSVSHSHSRTISYLEKRFARRDARGRFDFSHRGSRGG